MLRTISLTLLASLGLGLMASPSLAGTGKLEEIATSKTIILGHLPESIPFSFLDTDDQPKGYTVDLCKRVAASLQRQLGLERLDIKWVPLTLENRFEMVASGKVDLECGTSTNTIARQKIVDFSLMTWVDGGNFVTKGETRMAGLADMNGKRFAVIKGTTTEMALQKSMQALQITLPLVEVESHMQGLQLLNDGKVDAYAADQTVLIGLAASVSQQMRVSLAEHNFSYEPYALALRRNDADFKQAVNAALAQLYRSGEVFKIYANWFAQFGKPPQTLVLMYGLNALPE